MSQMSEKQKAEQRRKILAKIGIPKEYMKLFQMPTSEDLAAEEQKLPRLPGSDSPKLGLGTQGTGVTSTRGALNSDRSLNVPKIGRGDGLKPTMNQSPYAQESYDYARVRNKVGDKNFYAMDNAQRETAKRDERASDFKYQALSKDRQKFFNKPVVRNSPSKLQVGKLGESKEVYSPRRGLRRAMRTADVVRKRGYGDVASDIVRGGVGLAAKAPTTRSTLMKKAMEAQDREAQTIAAANAAAAKRRVREQFKGE
jgi:hypothetical protein